MSKNANLWEPIFIPTITINIGYNNLIYGPNATSLKQDSLLTPWNFRLNGHRTDTTNNLPKAVAQHYNMARHNFDEHELYASGRLVLAKGQKIQRTVSYLQLQHPPAYKHKCFKGNH